MKTANPHIQLWSEVFFKPEKVLKLKHVFANPMDDTRSARARAKKKIKNANIDVFCRYYTKRHTSETQNMSKRSQ